MADVMEFPDYWEDFVKAYSFTDRDHLFSNGSEFIDVYRVKQMVEHYFSAGADAIVQAVERDLRKPDRRTRFVSGYIEIGEDGYITQECLDRMNKDIENYNKGIVSEPIIVGIDLARSEDETC